MEDDNKLIKVEGNGQVDKPYHNYREPYPIVTETLIEEAHFRDYWRVVLKRKWTIITFAVALITIVTIASFKATPVFKATVKIEIESEKTNILPYKDVVELETITAGQDQYLQTQFKILQSRSLAKRVIEALSLGQSSNVPKPSVFDSLRLPFVAPVGGGTHNNQDEAKSKAVDKFLDNLEVSPIRNSRLVEVRYYSPDPKQAANIINTLANEYIQQNFESRYQATQKATEFLSRQLVDLKARVEKSEEELTKYAQAHNILGLDDKQNVTVRTLADLNDSLTKARTERMKKESLYQIAAASDISKFPEILKTPLIVDLEKKLATLKQEQARVGASFRPGWPELDQITSQIAETESQLQAEKAKSIRSIAADYETSAKHENLLRIALEQQKEEANRLNQNAIQYNILKREVDTNKQLYDGLLQRMKEASISAGLKSSNIRIVDTAEIPKSPDRPRKLFNIFVSLVIGLLVGVGLAFFREHMDSSVKTPEDIDHFVQLPNLGVIPLLDSVYSRKLLYGPGGNNGGHKKHVNGNGKLPSMDLITFTQSDSVISEAYRSLRTALLLSHSDKPPKTILVTSAQRGEGKTTTAINIAISLTQLGARVLILDCDMRNPRCHKALKLTNDRGMSAFLTGNTELSSLIKETQVPNLYVITGGKIPPNPAELLASPRMRQALDLLDELFDYIIVDSSPMLAVTDPMILSPTVDGVIFVIKAEETPKQVVKKLKQNLLSTNARILGVVINQANLQSADYNYRYGYYYSYGYYGDDRNGEST